MRRTSLRTIVKSQLFLFTFAQKVEGYCAQQNAAFNDLLYVGVITSQGHTVVQDTHDESADDSTDDGAGTTGGSSCLLYTSELPTITAV